MGYSRQYVYKQSKDVAQKIAQQQRVKQLVDRERKQLPGIGTRKIHFLIKDDLQQQGLKFGRDKLFALMRDYGLQIKPRRRYIQTTMSKHWLRKWPNSIKGITVNHPDEVWVSDITYLKTEEGTCYLNMITDAYSRKIVGYVVADMIKALKMATTNKKHSPLSTIHHSDRGLQY